MAKDKAVSRGSFTMLSKDSAPVRNLILIISNLLEKET
jgi:hypothetical protein